MDKRDLMNDRDAFWDLGSLIPPRRRTPPKPTFASAISTVEVQGVPEKKDPAEEAECHFSAPPPIQERVGEQVTELTRSDNRFISRVRLFYRSSEYRFYGQFCRDAVRLLSKEREACPYAPYFSYIPQYAHLTPEQLSYYLYWRSCARRGDFLKTEESYFLLYVYEIVNLPEFIEPKDGILQLCDAWAAYRKAFPRIDKFMTEWVMDYCLIHNLDCPLDRLAPFLSDILAIASHKEFYLGAIGDFQGYGTETALAFFSLYKFRESRYAKEHTAAFEEHIPAVMAQVLEKLQSQKDIFQEAARTVRVHEAFCGALCAQNIRCRIELTYYSVRDVSYLRGAVTAAVKYAENKLRAALSVKSRLAVPPLDADIRDLIDAYFDRTGASLRPAATKEAPVYERLYDAPEGSADLSRAGEIEQQSWSNTRALVTEEEWNEIQNNSETGTYFKAEVDLALDDELSQQEKRYLALLLAEDRAGVRALLSACSLLEEELASSINEKSMEKWQDVVLELSGEGYLPIPDYVQEVSEWIR